MVGCILQVLSVLLAANLIISEGKPNAPHPVHGVINQSADLTLDVNQTGDIQEIYWTYKTYILASYMNNHLVVRHYAFANRLETLNSGTTLRITNLRKEDGGIYTVSAHFIHKEINQRSYNLTVYDPVPSPVIWTEVKEDTTDQCNVTLYCSVPSYTSDFSYTWIYRHRDSEYQPYNNGSSIHISEPPDHADMELLCIVHNPADKKNASVNVRHICPNLVTINHRKCGKKEIFYFLMYKEKLKGS
ncbi:SLAM family member 5-like [Leptodactylus fuscus]